MANGAKNGYANVCDSMETLVSSIRPGMKREFLMMLKSQGEFPIEMGQRRTRSHNSPLNDMSTAKNGAAYDAHQSNKRLKGSSPKNTKKEVENEAVHREEGKAEDEAVIEGLKDKEAGNNCEMAGLVCEEEGLKNIVVDSSSDAVIKRNLVEEGMKDGQEKQTSEFEKLGSKIEIKSDTVKNAGETEIDTGKVATGDYTKEALIEEPKDGVVEGMNEDSEIWKGINGRMESSFEVGSMVEVSELGDQAAVRMAAFDAGGHSEKPLRQFTLSPLKPSLETSELSVKEDVKLDAISPAAAVEEPKDGLVEGMDKDLQIQKKISGRMESSFEVGSVVQISDLGGKVGAKMAAFDVGGNSEKPLRRFTRSLLKSNVEPLEHSVKDIKNGAASPVSMIEKLEDGEVESMNEDLQTQEISGRVKSGVEVGYVVEISDSGDKVGAKTAVFDSGGNSEKPSRRFTRSLLKPSMESLEHSVKDVKHDAITPAAPEEPKNGVLEGMNEELQMQNEIRNLMESGVEIGNLVEISDVGGNVGAKMSGFDSDGNSEKPLRRFTRSFLKPSVEASEHSVKHDVKNDTISPAPTSSKMEMKMSKKVELKKTPTKLKELLDTGLLEGLSVQYIRGPKARSSGGLQGLIQGSKILCFCEMCKGAEAVTPNQFELHAHSSNKRPPEYIYLENGRTLRDVLNACKGVPSDSLEIAIRQAVGYRDTGAKHAMDSKATSGSVESVQCLNYEGNELSANQLDDSSTSNIRFPLKSRCKTPSSHSKSKVQGRLTRKDLRLHKLVFESDFLPDGTELGYFSGGKRILSGHKSGQGIYCNCCDKVVSASTFEAHAGFASRRKPYINIFISNGVSLHELSIEIKRTMTSSTDENDDVCSICQDMGDLICCDNCPRAFHQGCVGVLSVPEGKWYCRQCEPMIEQANHAERNVNAVAAGRVAGVDPFEEIRKRCIRILDTVGLDDGGCVLCRRHEFANSRSEFGPLTVMICDQCENEYHVRCLKEHGMDDLKELPEGKWFCRNECRSIHSALQKLVADGEQRLPESLLNVIRKKHEETGSEDNFDPSITWRLLHGKTACEEDGKWLTCAVSVFHDQFDPIAVNSTLDDLIPFMIDGKSNKDQDFGGIYCAILIADSVVVSAGVLRVFGQEVAEIPLVATSNGCQGKGYFQSLFCCIEDFLASLNVRNLVLPAAPEAKSIWMNKFGFEKITEKQLKEYRKDFPIMVFQGTTILHKPVCKLELSTKLKDA